MNNSVIPFLKEKKTPKEMVVEISVDPGVYKVGAVVATREKGDPDNVYDYFQINHGGLYEKTTDAPTMSKLFRKITSQGDYHLSIFKNVKRFWESLFRLINLSHPTLRIPVFDSDPLANSVLIVEINDLKSVSVIGDMFVSVFLSLGGEKVISVHPRMVWRTMKPLVLDFTKDFFPKMTKTKYFSRSEKKKLTQRYASAFFSKSPGLDFDQADAVLNFHFSLILRKRKSFKIY